MRRRRLQPKAAPAPSRGRGPGTVVPDGEGGPRTTWIVSLVPSRVQVPIRPVVVKPRLARVLPLKVALLTTGVFDTYAGPIINIPKSPVKDAVIPEMLSAGALTDPLKKAGPMMLYASKVRSGPLQIIAALDSIYPLAPQDIWDNCVAPVRSRLPLA